MADINKLVPKILKWEGGFVNDPDDKGGATNLGITLENWKISGYDKDGDGDIDVDDLKIITKDDFVKFFRKLYWNRWQADQLINQSVADILVDWTYNSGSWGVRIPQTILGAKSDGLVGPATLKLVNGANQAEFFQKVWDARKSFYEGIVKRDAKQQKFLKGWMNRLNDYKFAP